jgi:hypothetical protein
MEVTEVTRCPNDEILEAGGPNRVPLLDYLETKVKAMVGYKSHSHEAAHPRNMGIICMLAHVQGLC